MKKGQGLNDSAHGMPDPSMKMDQEGQKQPGVVLEDPDYVSECSASISHVYGI